MTSPKTTPFLLVCAAMAGFPAAALAQHALGTGNALDANPQVGGDGRNTRSRDYKAVMKFNDAVVTGNAGLGRSFRGDAGYLASDEFRGSMGSDDLFKFNRDSYRAGGGIKGTDALRYQFALATGSTTDSLDDSSKYIISRSGGASSGWGVSSLRSTGEFAADAPLRRNVLGYKTSANGKLSPVTASPLLGVSVAPPEADTVAPPTTSPALPSTTPPIDPNAPISTSPAPNTVPSASAARVENRSATYRSLLSQVGRSLGEPVAEPTGEPVAPSEDSDMMKGLDRLRKQLRGEPVEEPQTIPEGTPDPNAPTTTPRPPGTSVQEPPPELDEAVRRLLDALKQPMSLDKLSAPSEGDLGAYARYMENAAKLLKDGRYFDAETGFARALAANPADPMARIGRLNAQIGAGLYLSSASNLRSFITEYPELVGVRLGAELLPSPDRMQRAATLIRERMDSPDSPLGADGALVLAYIGRQSGDSSLLAEGLTALEARTEADDKAGAALLSLLKTTWGEGAPK